MAKICALEKFQVQFPGLVRLQIILVQSNWITYDLSEQIIIFVNKNGRWQSIDSN